MCADATRKAVFVVLTIVTIVMLLVSRHHLVLRIVSQYNSSDAEYKPPYRLLMTEYSHVPTTAELSKEFPTAVPSSQGPLRHTQPHKNHGRSYSKSLYTAMNILVKQYQEKIERIREKLIENNITITKKSDNWELLNGYDEHLFSKVEKYANIIPIYLTTSMDLTREMLPAKKYYNYIASMSTCKKMDTNGYHGPSLLNKTCLTRISQVHNPVLLDITQLSVGIPFKMHQGQDFPVGPDKTNVLLHFGFIVRDALILSHGIVFSNGSALQPQRCKPNVKTRVPSNQNTLPIYAEVFSMTEQLGTMFYHLISEDLPRIGPYLEFLLQHNEIKIHCKQKSFLTNMLQFLGITSDRLISGDVHAKVVYMPAGTACGRPGVFTTQYLSTLFLRKLPKETLELKQDTIILIKRSSKGRRFINHKNILRMLQTVAKKRGLRAVEYRDDPTPSLNETIETFYRAVMVIAPHGAGLSNLLFSRPGVVILESYCMVNLCFRNLMANSGHIHHGYMNEDFSCLHAKPENFESDVEKHLDILGYKV